MTINSLARSCQRATIASWRPALFLLVALCGVACSPRPPAESPAFSVVRHFSVYESRAEYCAWPSLGRTSRGDLIVLFTRSEEHLGPDGAVVLCRSRDNGLTWEKPVVVRDTPIDDRESGLTFMRDGRIVGHLWSTFHTRKYYEGLPPGSYGPEVLDRWIQFVERPEYLRAEPMKGPWTVVSSDGGASWLPPVRGHDSVHGGIELADGSLLLASYRDGSDAIVVWRADRPEGEWKDMAAVRSPHPDSVSFGEPHILQLPSGRVIMMIRATAVVYNDQDPRCVLWETYSDDGGATWVAPYRTPLWGFPPHLALLADGRVLCTYGYRRPPYGQRACLSADGVRWELKHEVVLRDDAPNGDLGYPASIELEPGTILTVYYQPNVPPGTVQEMRPPDPHRTKPGILGTVWRVPAKTPGE